MVDRYRQLIEKDGGRIHRFENWGKRKLAYPIKQLYKACYALLNIECSAAVCDELKSMIRFNDAIVRTLLIRRDQAISEPSQMMSSDSKGGKGEEGKKQRLTPREKEKSLKDLSDNLDKVEELDAESSAEDKHVEMLEADEEQPPKGKEEKPS